jgi:hypothetical protein
MPRTSGVSDPAKNWRGFLLGGGENIFPNSEVKNRSMQLIAMVALYQLRKPTGTPAGR